MGNGRKQKIPKKLEPKENIGHNKNLVLPNWYGFNIEKAEKHVGGDAKYLGTFCIKGAYKPSAVFHAPNFDVKKGHKPYPFLFMDGKIMFIGGMSDEQMEMERYQSCLHCHNCGDVIYSVNVHDFRACSCSRKLKRIFVDGGRDYMRVVFGEKSSYSAYQLDFFTHELIPPNTFREILIGKLAIKKEKNYENFVKGYIKRMGFSEEEILKAVQVISKEGLSKNDG